MKIKLFVKYISLLVLLFVAVGCKEKKADTYVTKVTDFTGEEEQVLKYGMGYTSFETAFRTGDFSDNRRRLLDWKNENKTIQFGNRHQCIASRGKEVELKSSKLYLVLIFFILFA